MRQRAKPPALWLRLLADPNVGWPWPYFDDELTAIRTALRKVPNAEAALKAIVAEARRFLHPAAATERATHIRPNPRTQVQRLAAAVQEIKDALEALDIEAREHLHLSASLPDERPDTFQTAVYAFEYNAGLTNPPEVNVMGRKPTAHISALQLRIQKIIDRSYLPKRPPVIR